MDKNELIKLKALHTNLMVDDVASTLSFYTSIGFSINQQAPDKNPVWAYFTKDNAYLCFNPLLPFNKNLFS